MQQSRAITRKSASNLALAFILLPREKRDGMSVLYAFCREIDDISDELSIPAAERGRQLSDWREDLQRIYNGQPAVLPVNQELSEVISRYNLPFTLFDELIKGVEMDLEISRYQTFNDLELYCYRVASVVGLLSIEIFGYRNPACKEYAVALGKALQLTNILRDVQTDSLKGRIYLPAEEMERCGVSETEILRGQYSDRYLNLAEKVAVRAHGYYRQARSLLPAEERKNMAAAELMGSVYWKLLHRLEQERFNVFGSRITRVPKWEKVLLILRTWYRISSGAAVPNYGRSL
jgi:phytoene synthase